MRSFYTNKLAQVFSIKGRESFSHRTEGMGEPPDCPEYLFISFSGTQWDGPWYVRQKLMSEFSKKHKVIYVNPRREIREVITGLARLKNWNWGIRKVGSNLLLIESPWIFPKIYKLKYLDGVINWLYHRFIRFFANLIGRDCVKILYIWEPEFSPVVRHYPESRYIYHPYDLFEKYTHVLQKKEKEEKEKGDSRVETTEETAKARKNEKELVQNAFLFYSVSGLLCDHYNSNFGRRPTLLTNAVQNIYFSQDDKTLQEAAAKVLADFPKKKIAFSGSLIGSLNLEVVIDSASRLEDYAFLFIGPIRYTNIKEYDDKLKTLLSLKNVFQLGPYRVELLPYLLRKMDLLVMIYSNDTALWTHYSGPAKLFEYMACGRPILSTPHPAVHEYKKYIGIVEDSKQFVSAVRSIENGSNPPLLEEMKRIAAENTWEEREKMILRDIRNGMRNLSARVGEI